MSVGVHVCVYVDGCVEYVCQHVCGCICGCGESEVEMIKAIGAEGLCGCVGECVCMWVGMCASMCSY